MEKAQKKYKKRPDGTNDTGRPTVMTEETIGKLEQAWAMGCSDLEACLYAGIGKDALYNYQNKHPKYVERKEILKETLVLRSRSIVATQLQGGDREMAKWYLEKKRRKEFGKDEPINVSLVNNNAVGLDEDIIRKMNEELRGND